VSGGELQPGSDAREAKFFALDRLPEKMAFPTDLLICQKLRSILLNERDGTAKFCEDYKEYFKA
jgi:8-oxo-dGTP diphosphatase